MALGQYHRTRPGVRKPGSSALISNARFFLRSAFLNCVHSTQYRSSLSRHSNLRDTSLAIFSIMHITQGRELISVVCLSILWHGSGRGSDGVCSLRREGHALQCSFNLVNLASRISVFFTLLECRPAFAHCRNRRAILVIGHGRDTRGAYGRNVCLPTVDRLSRDARRFWEVFPEAAGLYQLLRPSNFREWR